MGDFGRGEDYEQHRGSWGAEGQVFHERVENCCHAVEYVVLNEWLQEHLQVTREEEEG